MSLIGRSTRALDAAAEPSGEPRCIRFVRLVAALALAFAAAGCAGSGDERSPTQPTASASLTAEGCPIDDPDFCARAAEAANALLSGSADDLVALSLADRFACAEVPAGLFPQCEPGRVLSGHPVSGVDGRFEVLDAPQYRDRLSELAGSSDVEVRGVGTCGPADPERRSYHLAFGAAKDGEPWLGSLEFVFRDGAWSIGVLYADSVENWKREYADPAAELACGNVQEWS